MLLLQVGLQSQIYFAGRHSSRVLSVATLSLAVRSLIVEILVLNYRNDKVSRDKSNDHSFRVEHRIRMVVGRGQGFHDILDLIDRLQSFQIRRHDSVSLNLLARSRNLVNKNRHLLAPA